MADIISGAGSYEKEAHFPLLPRSSRGKVVIRKMCTQVLKTIMRCKAADYKQLRNPDIPSTTSKAQDIQV